MRETDRDVERTDRETVEEIKRKEGGDHTIFERLGKVKESGKRCLERQKDFERESERVRETDMSRQTGGQVQKDEWKRI